LEAMRFPFALVTSNISRCVTLGALLKSANPETNRFG